MKALGITLIIIGVLMFMVSGFSITTEENLIDIGPIHINTEKENNINWPPYTGAVAVLAGIGTLILSRKR
ncbi:hypothetical protein [Echinicola sediminis]